MPIPKKKYERVHVLLDSLYEPDKAAQFPVALYSQKQGSVNFNQLFEDAETCGVGGKRLLFFVALSLSLFENMGANTPWVDVLHKFFEKEGLQDLYKEFYANFIKQTHLSFKEDDFNFMCTVAATSSRQAIKAAANDDFYNGPIRVASA